MVDDILCYSVEIVRIQISPPLKVTPIFEGLLRNIEWADLVMQVAIHITSPYAKSCSHLLQVNLEGDGVEKLCYGTPVP